MRFGGCYPAIHVQADVRRTRLIGTTQVYEGGVHDGARPRPHLPNDAT